MIETLERRTHLSGTAPALWSVIALGANRVELHIANAPAPRGSVIAGSVVNIREGKNTYAAVIGGNWAYLTVSGVPKGLAEVSVAEVTASYSKQFGWSYNESPFVWGSVVIT